jgi:hypothetical protein
MIKWIEYENQKPEEEDNYLVYDGEHVDIAYFFMGIDEPWDAPSLSLLDEGEITHWAKINLPGESVDTIGILNSIPVEDWSSCDGQTSI